MRTRTTPTLRRAASVTALTALLVGSLAGCGGSTTAAGTSTTTPAASSTTAAPVLTITDAWTKTAESGMTATFGVLHNSGDTDVTVTGASSPAASMIELHEVVMVDGASTMRPKKGGFVVPAGGTHELAPGGDHIMFMGLTGPVVAGSTVPVTLTYDGGTYSFEAVAKDFAGGNETYAPPATGMPGMTP